MGLIAASGVAITIRPHQSSQAYMAVIDLPSETKGLVPGASTALYRCFAGAGFADDAIRHRTTGRIRAMHGG